MLPILRNTAAGLIGVDPAVVEAARGVGMTDRQRLWRIELPIALPVIMAGVRTAAVWTIGAATLSTPVGQTSLGDYIFSGLQTEDWVAVLVGCAASAVLALVVDQLLGLIETGVGQRKRGLWIAGAAGLAVGLIAALAPLAGGALSQGRPSYVIGAKNFSEQYILAELMATRVEAKGGRVERKINLGSAVAYRALAAGEIDAYVDYSGTLWANVLNRKDNPGRAAVLDQLRTGLKDRDGVVLLAPLGFENAYALAMRRDTAERLGIRTLADLAAKGLGPDHGRRPGVLLASRMEERRERLWPALQGQAPVPADLHVPRLGSGEADVISAFSSDGRIAADDLVLLGDPKGALPPYDAVILISPKRAGDKRLIEALAPLAGSIDVKTMQAANYAVDRDAGKVSAAEAARMLEVK
jgi:osmoprotectant transport system permease protein